MLLDKLMKTSLEGSAEIAPLENSFLELELGVPIPNKWPSLESLERLPPRETALPCLRGFIKSKLLFHHLY